MELNIQLIPLLPGEDSYQKGIKAIFSDQTEKAFEYFKASEEAGFLAASIWLHNLYEDDTRPEDEPNLLRKAIKWLQKQDKNLPWVQNDLGFCYDNELGDLDADQEEALRLYRLAAEQKHLPACLNLFHFYHPEGEHRDLKEAFKFAKMAADAGDPEMQCYVADCYRKGSIIDQSDPSPKATKNAAKFTQQMQDNLSLKIDKSPKNAFHYYQLAADQKYAGAQYQLSLLYEKGYKGVVLPNQKLANRYLISAAMNGHERASKKAEEIEDSQNLDRKRNLAFEGLNLPFDSFSFIQQKKQYSKKKGQIDALKKASSPDYVSKKTQQKSKSENANDLSVSAILKHPDTIEKTKSSIEELNDQLAELNQAARNPYIPLLKSTKEFKLHHIKLEIDNIEKEDPLAFEKNLAGVLCYTQGISGCEKNLEQAAKYYQAALALANSITSDKKQALLLNDLVKKSVDVDTAIVSSTEIKPYECLANVLLYDLFDYYAEEAKSINLADETPNPKATALSTFLPFLNKTLASVLEDPNNPQKQTLLTNTVNAMKTHEALRDDKAFLRTLGNVVVGLTVLGLIGMCAQYAVTGHFGFFRHELTDKIDAVAQAPQKLSRP